MPVNGEDHNVIAHFACFTGGSPNITKPLSKTLGTFRPYRFAVLPIEARVMVRHWGIVGQTRPEMPGLWCFFLGPGCIWLQGMRM